MSNNDLVNCEPLELFAQTEDAILVGYPTGVKCTPAQRKIKEWIPRSKIENTDLYEVGDIGYIEIPFWIVADRGLPSDTMDR